jgi:transposase
MRKGFEGLSVMVREVVQKDPTSGHLFLFVNRIRDKLKILYFDRSGFALWYKELQRGTFTCPEKEEINTAELLCVLEGIEIASIARKKRYFMRKSDV